MKFDREYLFSKVPRVRYCDCTAENRYRKTKALFYEGEAYQGRPTSVFAYLGIPSSEMPAGGFPAVVLVHGGGGCAFYEWAAYWNGKGYVAIAPDFGGRQFGTHTLDGAAGQGVIPENPDAGPHGYGSFETPPEEYVDSWMYHSVCNIIFANNILRSLPEVNSDKIVLTGISWGGVLTCITSGIDDRFRAFAPVYGCGCLRDIPGTKECVKTVKDIRAWSDCYDPDRYLKNCRNPILFTVGADEPFFDIRKNFESSLLCKGQVMYSYRKTLPHYHRWKDEEGMSVISRFFDSVINGREIPISIAYDRRSADMLYIRFYGTALPQNISFVYITKEGSTMSREKNLSAIDSDSGSVCFHIPQNADVFFAECTAKQNSGEIVLSTPLFRR